MKMSIDASQGPIGRSLLYKLFVRFVVDWIGVFAGEADFFPRGVPRLQITVV